MMKTTDNNKESILRKVQSLLAKTTEKGATESEAEQAMLIAQKLMIKYHIDTADLNLSQSADIIETLSTERSALSQWAIRLLHIVANNFRCKSLLRNNIATLVGEDTDVALAVEMYKMLYDFMERGSRRIRRQYRKQGLSTKGIADSYLLGFLSGLNEAMEAQKKQLAEDELNEGSTDTTFAMVLVTPEAVLKAHHELTKGSRTISGRSLRGNDGNAFHQGKQEGRNSLNKRLK